MFKVLTLELSIHLRTKRSKFQILMTERQTNGNKWDGKNKAVKGDSENQQEGWVAILNRVALKVLTEECDVLVKI